MYLLFMGVTQNQEKKNDSKKWARKETNLVFRRQAPCPRSTFTSPAPSLEETLTGLVDELV